jgi:hypothetical protein
VVPGVVTGYGPHWRNVGMEIRGNEDLFPPWKGHIRCDDDEPNGLIDQVVLEDG